jgi:hypothetical protein
MKNQKSSGEWHQKYIIVKTEIDKWNPYGLLLDAPDDEFDNESRTIACNINYDSSIYQIAQVISCEFSRKFEAVYFKIEDCMNVACNIKESLDGIKNNR